jgi:[histone H3]-trimethyl-L-lysine4 demethylase
MATSEEAETQRFYLRKIEGAEILLAYETNFFRQVLHKWSPVAPDPPPVLESSKSTRKPRPTKLQKLMAQHGVDDPEALPQALRTKQHNFKRKSTEPTNARPPPLQPAPGRSASGTPTTQRFPVSGPPSIHHGPVLSGVPQEHHPSFTYDPHTFPMSSSSAAPPAFAPHAFLPPPYVSNSPRPNNLDPGIFTGAALARSDPALGVSAPLESPVRDNFTSSSQGANIEKMFNDLTNQEDDGLASQGDQAAPATSGSAHAITTISPQDTKEKDLKADETISREPDNSFLDPIRIYDNTPFDDSE